MPLKEKLLLQRIRRAAGRRGGLLRAGIGDDCAILRLPKGHEALITTDFSLEDVHFRRDWHPADSVGHRCLARGFSDIAAMGGVPQAAFLSLALPPDLPQKWVDDFMAGLLKLAGRYSVPLAGGDTAQSPDGVLADIVVLGSVPVGKAILRSGAKSGDLVYVTGTLGSSLADLNRLRDGEKLRPKSHPKHFYPEPRIAVGRFLREKRLASAMIDISDGLSTDLSHMCEESKTGAVIYAEGLARIVTRAEDGGITDYDTSRAAAAAKLARGVSPGKSRRTSEPRSGDTAEPHSTSDSKTRFVSGHDPSAGSGQAFSRAESAAIEDGALAPANLDLALHGGDEYELLFTARPDRRMPSQIAGVPITRIGEIVRGTQMKLVTADGKTRILKPAGWEHFG